MPTTLHRFRAVAVLGACADRLHEPRRPRVDVRAGLVTLARDQRRGNGGCQRATGGFSRGQHRDRGVRPQVHASDRDGRGGRRIRVQPPQHRCRSARHHMIVTHAFNFVGPGAIGLVQTGDGDPTN